MTHESLEIQRVRHPIKTRLLTVRRITELSPAMRRITLAGDDLAGFSSASFDDHVKLIVPEAQGDKPNMPSLGDKGLVFDPDRPKPTMRDYTPRRYDPDTNELDIDFVRHHEGPATNWAEQACVGDYIGIAGPRGSFVVPTGFDWHLLIGDETAIPAIARRLEELPSRTHAIAIIKIGPIDARIDLDARCTLDLHWVSPDEKSPDNAFELAVRSLTLPEGEGYVWAAGEYSDIKSIRQYLVDEAGIAKDRIRAASYWRKSTPDSTERFD